MCDRSVLYAAAFLRALATGMVSVLMGIYLAKLGLNPAEIGIVVAAGLAGAAVAALLVTLRGDRMGRRPTLITLSLLGAAGGAAIAFASGVRIVALVAFVGMLNGMGRDRGASLIIDQAILPATATDAGRTKAFAWYNVFQDMGHALGGLLAGTPVILGETFGFEETSALRLTMTGYGCIWLAVALLYAQLSRGVETPRSKPTGLRISPQTRHLVWKISSLFAVDGLGGGFLTTALLAFFFYQRFGAGEAAVGFLFFGSRLANAASHLGAAWLAKRIGLVNTMVFTHIPSSLLLAAVAFAPNFPLAAVFFLVREALVEMDVPTRQSYVMAVVQPEERTFASGLTHLVRLGSWALAPAFAGLLMKGLALTTPLFAGAGLKISYDLLLYGAFRRHRPPEERRDRSCRR